MTAQPTWVVEMTGIHADDPGAAGSSGWQVCADCVDDPFTAEADAEARAEELNATRDGYRYRAALRDEGVPRRAP